MRFRYKNDVGFVAWKDGKDHRIESLTLGEDGLVEAVAIDGQQYLIADVFLRKYVGTSPQGENIYEGDLCWVEHVGKKFVSIFGERGLGSSTPTGYGWCSSVYDIVSRVGFIEAHKEFYLDYLIENAYAAVENPYSDEYATGSAALLRVLQEAKRQGELDIVYSWGQSGVFPSESEIAKEVAISNANLVHELAAQGYLKVLGEAVKPEHDANNASGTFYQTQTRDFRVQKQVDREGCVFYKAYVHVINNYTAKQVPTGKGNTPFEAIRNLLENLEGYEPNPLTCTF